MTLAAFVVPRSALQTLQRVIESVSGPLVVNFTAIVPVFCIILVQLAFAKILHFAVRKRRSFDKELSV